MWLLEKSRKFKTSAKKMLQSITDAFRFIVHTVVQDAYGLRVLIDQPLSRVVTANCVNELLQNWNYVNKDMKVCTYTLQTMFASEAAIYSSHQASMPVVSSITTPLSRSSRPSYGHKQANFPSLSWTPSTILIAYLCLLQRSFVGHYMWRKEVHFCELGHHLFDICQVIGAPDWLLQQHISTKIVSGFLFECQERGARDGGNGWRCDGQ